MGGRIIIRAGSVRHTSSFGISGLIHGSLLGWLLWASALPPPEPRQTIYEQEIKPYEKHVVWYNLRDKLPEVKPESAGNEPKPLRAMRKFPQSIVSGKKDDLRPPQLIVTPAPPVELPEAVRLPNVLAVAESRPRRAFLPPPPEPPRPGITAPVLPEPPPVRDQQNAHAIDLSVPAVRPLKPFTAPAPARADAAARATLPEAPKVAMANAKEIEWSAPVVRPIKAFTPPAQRRTETAPSVSLPEAPRVAIDNPKLTVPLEATPAGPRRAFSIPTATVSRAHNMGADIEMPELTPSAALSAAAPRIPRGFSAPPSRPQANSGAPGRADPAAPELKTTAPLSAALPRIPRGFTPPVPRTATAAGDAATISAPEPAPTIHGTATPGATATMVVAGLNPANTMEIPTPPGSHEAGFSAGPKPNATGAESAANPSAPVTVRGLSTRGGVQDISPTLVSVLAPPTAKQNLLAALRAATPAPATAPAPSSGTAARVSTAPDPRFAGRYIYMVAIQMPNVSSYSGSWIVWFAEHQPEPGAPREIRPPVAVHKVDPKYVAAALDEKVEGTVRLSAVIRKTGRVDSVQLLQHLDTRLDHTAEEALAKWEFEPAQCDGNPVDVDAVFEIPFRLAPKPKR